MIYDDVFFLLGEIVGAPVSFAKSISQPPSWVKYP